MSTITDAFTATDGTHLVGRSTDTGSKTWQVSADVFTVQSNHVERTGSGWEQAWVDSGTTDGTSECDLTELTGYCAVIGRVSAGGTHYAAVNLAGGSSGLYAYVSTAQTTLDTSGPGLSEGDRLGIRITGWVIELLRNGASVLTYTDTAHTIAAGTGWGFAHYNAGHFDNFTATYTASGIVVPGRRGNQAVMRAAAR